MVFTVLFSVLFATLGFISGLVREREVHSSDSQKESHEFDQLFEENPHPEIFDKDGKVNKGEYMFVKFDLGYDADEFDPEDIVRGVVT